MYKVLPPIRAPTSNVYALCLSVAYPLLHVRNAHTCTSDQFIAHIKPRYREPLCKRCHGQLLFKERVNEPFLLPILLADLSGGLRRWCLGPVETAGACL